MTWDERGAAAVRQNLVDAVCPETLIGDYMKLWSEGRTRDQVSLLQSHRKNLLERMHGYQYALDCLDYLLFTIEKTESKP